MSKRRKKFSRWLVRGSALGLILSYLFNNFVMTIELPGFLIIMVLSLVAPWLIKNGRSLFRIGPGYLYEYTVRHPVTDKVVCGYVGKTRRDPKVRYEEHMGRGKYGKPAQPWTDTVVRWKVIYDSKRVTDIGLSLREQFHIRVRRPLYNVTYNMGNRRRIPPHVAKQQRSERDRRSGWGLLGPVMDIKQIEDLW